MMLTKKAFDDECIKHPDALSLTSLRYIFFVLVFAFGYSAADIWASRQALRMFLLEATHVGNIDPTYFVSIQATSSGSGSVLFAHHSEPPLPPVTGGCMQRYTLLSGISYQLSTLLAYWI